MTNPTLVTTPFAENGDKNTIPNVNSDPENPQLASNDLGFPPITQQKVSLGGIPPERNDFNGILNLYGQHIVHLNKGLPYEFDTAFATAIGGYPLNARIMLTNGNIVKNTLASNTSNPNSDMIGWVLINAASQILDESGKTQQEINNLLIIGTTSTYVIAPPMVDISLVLNSVPSGSTVILKNGNYTASGVEILKDNVVIECQSDAAVITLKAGTNGVFMRFGKRGPSSDYRGDNLPVYNGTIDYWDESQYSPSTAEYPRISGSGIKGGTIVLDNSNGVGGSTGLDFYRCDNPVMQTKIKWASKFTFGNGVRIHFCKNMTSDYIEIDDNENCTYSLLYYWSFGLSAGNWKIGKSSTLSIDFKHSVNGRVEYLESRGTGANGNSAVNVGYGSISNTFGKIIATNGDVTLKASVEFDMLRGVIIGDLNINNPAAEGLTLQHVSGLQIGKYNIRARVPISLTPVSFFMFSNDSSITPSQNSKQYVFDGNYSTTATEAGYTKYYEKRPYPVLHNSKLGTGVLTTTDGAYCIFSNIAGGVADMMGTDGRLYRFNSVPNRGFDESKRVSFQFNDTIPSAISNVDIGNPLLVSETVSSLTMGCSISSPIVNSSGNITTSFDKKSMQWVWMFGSSININALNNLTSAAGFVFECDSMVNSTLGGTWRASGRVGNFKGGNATFYKDGYKNHKLTGVVLRPTAPIASPPFVTNFASSTPTWDFVNFSGVKSYASDGSATTNDNHMIRHIGSLPVGVLDTQGGGYIQNGSFQDGRTPFRRIFTTADANTPPTITPNFVGELCENTVTSIWWKAITTATWSKL